MGKISSKKKVYLEHQEGNKRITLIYLGTMGCEDGRWNELVKDHVQLWALVFSDTAACLLATS
jgi:hypothetical protein